MVNFFIMYVIFIIIFAILSLAKVFKFHSSNFITALLYLILQQSQGIITTFLNLMNCRKIGSHSYMSANLLNECGSNPSMTWGYAFIFLVIWGIIIPMIIWSILYKSRDNLASVKGQFTFGFLYREYKLETYYWEIVKIFVRSSMLLFTLINDKNTEMILKGFVIIFYHYLVKYY